MIDHLGITVGDMARSLAFYDPALAPLGVTRIMTLPKDGPPVRVGYGRDRKPWFWISASGTVSGPIHIAFAAPDRPAVDAFHAAALAAGGTGNGAPGPRAKYHPNYYAAFVFDPDGNNVEAMHHAP